MFDETDVVFIDGIPQLSSIYDWIDDIINEYIKNLYRGLNVERKMSSKINIFYLIKGHLNTLRSADNNKVSISDILTFLSHQS